MIVISHDPVEGTILSGSRKGDGVWEIVRQHGFRSSREIGLYIRGSRDRDAQTWRIEAAATALRAAGFEVTVEIDDQWRPAADREAAYTDRADERAPGSTTAPTRQPAVATPATTPPTTPWTASPAGSR
jgi:hypothetical protein